jgi:hypothetical protein
LLPCATLIGFGIVNIWDVQQFAFSSFGSPLSFGAPCDDEKEVLQR